MTLTDQPGASHARTAGTPHRFSASPLVRLIPITLVLGVFVAANVPDRVRVPRRLAANPAARVSVSARRMPAGIRAASATGGAPEQGAVPGDGSRGILAVSGAARPAVRQAIYVLPSDTFASDIIASPDVSGRAPVPVAGEIVRGAARFPDGVYVFREGQIYRGSDVVGSLTSSVAASRRGPALSVRYQYLDQQSRICTGDLLASRSPLLEGSALQIGQEWWAYAAGDWVRLGKPLVGHTYPGFEVTGGGSLRSLIRELTRPAVTTRRHHRRRRRAAAHAPAFPSFDLEMIDQIAAVETSGQLDCVNTYDNGVVSFGLRQWTLSSGRLQAFIYQNGALFAPYGIAAYPDLGLAAHPDWYWIVNGHPAPRVYGAQKPEDLTSPYWTAKFFRAGQDRRIIMAELRLAARELYRGSQGESSVLREAMQLSPYFRYSPAARALLAELENNRPEYSRPVVASTLSDPNARPGVPEHQFVEVLLQHIVQPYESEFARRAAHHGAAAPDAARAAGDKFALGWMSRALHTSPRMLELVMTSPIPAPPAIVLSPRLQASALAASTYRHPVGAQQRM